MQQKPTFDHSRAWHSEKHSLLVPRKHIHVRLAYAIFDGITHLNTHVPCTSALYIFLLASQIVDALLVLSAFSCDICKRDWRYSYRSKYRGFSASFFFASKQRMISRWFSAHEPGLGLFPFALAFVMCRSFRFRILFSSRTICDHPPGDFYP